MRDDESYGNLHRSGARWCCCPGSLRCTAAPRGRVCLDVGQALLGLLLLNHVLVGRVEDVVDGTQKGTTGVALAAPPVDPATALHPQEELVHGRQGGDGGDGRYDKSMSGGVAGQGGEVRTPGSGAPGGVDRTGDGRFTGRAGGLGGTGLLHL